MLYPAYPTLQLHVQYQPWSHILGGRGPTLRVANTSPFQNIYLNKT
jgi:hypothetical protein